MRIYVERSSGLPIKHGRKFDGVGHEFIDVTNRPHPTIDVRPMTQVIIDHMPDAPGRPIEVKPAYCLPTMAEVAAMPWNGYTAASTFSGCGGSSLGYRLAGFRIAWASEFVPAARESYAANMAPGTILDPRDIRTVQAEDIIAATGIAKGELDLLDGSPPCASFSSAGSREAGWGLVRAYSDTEGQRVDDLFGEFARLLAGLQPRTFIAENVSGLVKGTAKGYFIDILKSLKACGYRVEAQLLDAQWLGVPQARQRLIFQGVRNDLGLAPAFPKPLLYRYSVREALLPGDVEADADMTGYAVGAKWDKLGPGDNVWYGGKLIRPRMDTPCPTITAKGGDASAASVTHPLERRKFSIAELRRICAFPADFVLTGSYAQQWERLGRAVPPIMMAAIARSVRDGVLDRIKK